MKRLVLVALLCVLLGAVAFAETEDEARAALQNTLMELEETYGAELLPEEQMQLSFLIDWADRYVESEQWAQFAEDFGQCQDAQKLSELLNTDYMGINQAEEGLMQREEARQRSIEIVQAAGFDLEQMPYVSLGSKGGWNGWEVRVSQIPGDEQRTPGVMLDHRGGHRRGHQRAASAGDCPCVHDTVCGRGGRSGLHRASRGFALEGHVRRAGGPAAV